ncbi:MAG: hypothetical protein J6V44_05235 [Methanobrevibacter sp.]|nr:hypothetical protein [Methanobrevibacter sp.]
MNNILTFEDYRKMNIRQVESVIYRQFIEEDIKDKNEVSEGFLRRSINKRSSKFIQAALADEIEKGKELEKSIKDALDGLNKGFEDIKTKIDANPNSKSKLAAIETIKDAIKSVQSQAFDTLTMIGSEGEIDFAGFIGSASIAAAVNFGILFSPIRSVFMTRKAYKYFLSIIKQTIRRNLLVMQLNFDQFENLILQKSFESEEDSEFTTKILTLNEAMRLLTEQLCDGKNKFLKGNKNKELKDKIEIIRKNTESAYRQKKADYQNNPLRSLWEDQHNNTYTRTLEQIKQYINEDSQKEMDALKNSITKMAGNDVDLVPYGEMLISAAEEYAINTNHGINNNFIKMSSVFNLENQKKLIELIKDAEDERRNEIEIEKNKLDFEKEEEERKKNLEEGKKLYEEKLKDSTENFSFDEFNDTFDDTEQKCLRVFFQSDDGKDAYKELIEKNPLYKYLLFTDVELTNTFFSAMSNLDIIKVEKMRDFYTSIVDQDHTIYYMMGEKSIRNAIKGKPSADYFGFNIGEQDIKRNCLLDKNESPIFRNIIGTKKTTKKTTKDGKETTHTEVVPIPRYFLTFSDGDNLFNILHNDFKTKIFKDSGEYENDISIENKEAIIKLIHKHIKIGNSVSSRLAEYLVRLEAHMLLKNQKPWFVVKNNKKLYKCFDPTSDKIINKNAFVEIKPEHYEDIEKFLKEYKDLYNKDFKMSDSEPKGTDKDENK